MFDFITRWFEDEEQKYFRLKLKDLRYKVYHHECMRYQAKELHEEARQLFDAEKARIQAANEWIDKNKKLKDGDKNKLKHDELERKKDKVALMEKKRDEYKDKMKDLQIQIDGEEPSAEHPLGQHGIEEQLSAWHETIELVTKYMNRLKK